MKGILICMGLLNHIKTLLLYFYGLGMGVLICPFSCGPEMVWQDDIRSWEFSVGIQGLLVSR